MVIRWAAAVCAAGATLAFAAQAMADTGPEAAPAARPPAGPTPTFQIDASNGYGLTGTGMGGTYSLIAGKGAMNASYTRTTDVVTTTKSIEAKYPGYGKVNLKFEPKGPKKTAKLPPGCTGTPDEFRKGTWTGTIRFTTGFTKVNADKAGGRVVYPGSYLCSVPFFSGGVLRASKDEYEFTATDPSGDPPPSFDASHTFYDGDVEVELAASVVGEASDFVDGSSTVTVTPPTPFKGTGTYTTGGDVWFGDLSVKVPGETIDLITGFDAQFVTYV